MLSIFLILTTSVPESTQTGAGPDGSEVCVFSSGGDPLAAVADILGAFVSSGPSVTFLRVPDILSESAHFLHDHKGT